NRPTRNNQSYVVFVLRDGQLVVAPIRTGLTDQDYVEVMSGLTERDTVLVLPSASLVQSQQQFKQRFQNVTGGGLPGLRQSGGSRCDPRPACSPPAPAALPPAGTPRPPPPIRKSPFNAATLSSRLTRSAGFTPHRR